MIATFLVFLGGGIGAALRHGVNIASAQLFGAAFPWGTLIVNVVGSLLIGALMGWFAFRNGGTAQHVRLFLATGVLGGFTTFSAFSYDYALLFERGEFAAGAGYVAASVALSLAAVFLGLYAARSLG
jgi:CrcB protein